MAGRTIFSVPLNGTFTPHVSSRTATRCIHCSLRSPPVSRLAPPFSKRRPSSLLFRRAFAKDSTRTFRGNLRVLWKKSPLGLSLALGSITVAAIGGMVYLNYYYQKYIIGQYHNYPEAVAKKLRRAIYYTNVDLQPQEALNYYKQANKIASELGMDPYSDEVMGIKIQIAALMEKCNQFTKAIEVLETIKAHNMKALEEFDQKPELWRDPDLRKKRTRILLKTIAISIKLGEHYSNPVVWDRDAALDRLIWAVETAYQEKNRRQRVGATQESDGAWMTNDELGAGLETLAHGYEEKDMHYLSTPLFLQALNLKEANDCHSVVLMNNVATSLAQQSPKAARSIQAYADSRSITTPDAPSGPVATKETMVENARLWAVKALDVAAHIEPPLRTEECDVGCAVAMHNLGEFAEMLQDVTTAEKKYKEAVSLSRAIGFQEGVENSSARLRVLKGQRLD